MAYQATDLMMIIGMKRGLSQTDTDRADVTVGAIRYIGCRISTAEWGLPAPSSLGDNTDLPVHTS